MRGRGLKVSGNILVLIRTTVVLPSRRMEGSPRRVGSHRDRTSAAQDGARSWQRTRRALGGLRATGGDPRGSRSRVQLHLRERDSRDGQDGMGREGQGVIAHRPGQPPRGSCGGGTVSAAPTSAPRTMSSDNFSMPGG